MKTKTEEFEVLIPNLDGAGIGQRVKVPITLEWDEEVQQWLVTPKSHELIDRTKARLIGLLLPEQLKELRERYDYTQKEMGELFQVGEKSWTRWESGKHRPSRSINLIIRALYEGEISINYLLKRAGKPPCEVAVVSEREKFPGWLAAIVANPFGTSYMAEGIEVICCKSSEYDKASFLEAFTKGTHQSTFQEAFMRKRETTRSLLPTKAGHRFDYEKINISSPTYA
jgi:transcriptional regulator with XRE-family HTH domain